MKVNWHWLAYVIVEIGEEEIKDITSLFVKYRENLWRGYLNLTIIRNQKEKNIKVDLQ